MKFNKISKILLVFLILVIFMNIVCASDDISVDENLALEDNADLAVPQDSALPEGDSSYDDSLGVTDEDTLKASKHVTIDVECLNKTTLYPGDVIRYKVNITNDGEVNFTEKSLNLDLFINQLSKSPTFLNWEGDWDLSLKYSRHIEGKNLKPLNVGESSVVYVDLTEKSWGTMSFYAYVETPTRFKNYVDTFLSRANIEFKKELVNDETIFLGDYVTFNVTVNNTDYMKNGKKWYNVTISDSYSSRFLEFVNIVFFDYNGNVIDLPYEFYTPPNYGLKFTIPEFDNPISFLATFKAVDAGKTTNKVSLSLINRTDSYGNGWRPNATADVFINHYLKVNKTAKNETYYIGDLVEYNVTVENIWKKAIKDILITEEVPFGLTFESFEGDGWTQIGKNTFKYNGPLNPEDKTVLHLKFTVTDADWANPTFPKTIKNTVRFTYNNITAYVSAPITVAKPPVVINKKSLNKSVELGDNVVFNITIADLNEEGASHVIMIKDIVPDGLEFIGCSGIDSDGNEIDVSYSIEDGNVIFKIAEFYHNATIIATFKTTETGNITNTVVYGLNNNNVKEGEYSQDSVLVKGRMTVDKKCMNETVFSGDPITFMVNITNNEGFDLTNITLNENFPDDLTYISFKGNNWTEEGNNKFRYQGSLSPNDSTCIYFNFVVSSDSKGYLKNKVTVNSNEVENISSTDQVYVNEPKISISKKSGNTRVKLGENVVYIISVTCLNSQYCYNVDVTDLPADGLEFISASYSDNGQSIPAVYEKDGNKIVFHLDKINKTMNIVVTFKTTATGVLKNTAIYKNINRDCDIIVSDLTLDLIKVTEDYVFIKPDSQLTVQGDDVLYWVMITNKGKENLTNFTLTEHPPEGFTFVSYEGNFEKVGDNVFKYIGTLASGSGADFLITYHVSGNVSGKLTNSITASANEIGNVTSSFSVYVEKQNVKIDKLALNKTAWVGENVTFDIIVSNNSTGTAHGPDYNGGGIISAPNPDSEDLLEYPEVESSGDGPYYIYHDVQIIDYVPDGLEFLDCYALDQHGEKIPVTYRIEGKKIIFTLDTLKRIATIKTTFKAIAPGNQTNVIEKDNQTSNDTVEVKSKNATVQKITLNQTVSLGEDVSFTIVVTNTGTTDLSEITITEKNPEGLEYKSFSGTGWSTKDGVHFRYDGILTPDESINLVITFKAIKAGNWTNVVMLKTNATEEKDSNNTTSVIENKTNTTITQNKTNTTIPDNETDIPIPDNDNETVPIHTTESKVSEIKTGNPILVLLMVLLMLSGNYIRKIKK